MIEIISRRQRMGSYYSKMEKVFDLSRSPSLRLFYADNGPHSWRAGTPCQDKLPDTQVDSRPGGQFLDLPPQRM